MQHESPPVHLFDCGTPASTAPGATRGCCPKIGYEAKRMQTELFRQTELFGHAPLFGRAPLTLFGQTSLFGQQI